MLPALELIAVIANADAGQDGMYRTRQTDAVIRRYLRAARRAKALLLLDIQPGALGLLHGGDAARALAARARRRPRARPGVAGAGRARCPGEVIGSVDSREVNAVTAWLDAADAQERDLPEKLVVIHQFTDDMVDDTTLQARDGLQIVLNADGFGTPPVKKSQVRRVHAARAGLRARLQALLRGGRGADDPAPGAAPAPAAGLRRLRVTKPGGGCGLA